MHAAPKKIRVGIFVETQLMLDSLMVALRREPGFVCSKMDDPSIAWTNQPDVILLDWQDATDVNLKQLSATCARAKVVVMNGDHSGLDLVLCSRIGVAGFTLKRSTSSELVRTIRAAAAGVCVIPECIGTKLYEQVHATDSRSRALVASECVLSSRESAVACLAADGLTNKEIGAKLSIEMETVKTHMRSIFRKLRFRNRIQLVRMLEMQNRELTPAVPPHPTEVP